MNRKRDLQWLFNNASPGMQESVLQTLVDDSCGAYESYCCLRENDGLKYVEAFTHNFYEELKIAMQRRLDYEFQYRDAVMVLASALVNNCNKTIYARAVFIPEDDKYTVAFLDNNLKLTNTKPSIFQWKNPNEVTSVDIVNNEFNYHYVTLYLKVGGALVPELQ